MRPYVLTPEFSIPVPEEDLILLEKIRHGFNALPDIDLGRESSGMPYLVSCHMLARAFGDILSLRVRDGLFIGRINHSWLMTPSSDNILDVYPVAIVGGPILVVAASTLNGMYIQQPPRRLPGCGIGTKRFQRAVDRLTEELRAIPGLP